jgi:hypothetical protein
MLHIHVCYISYAFSVDCTVDRYQSCMAFAATVVLSILKTEMQLEVELTAL